MLEAGGYDMERLSIVARDRTPSGTSWASTPSCGAHGSLHDVEHAKLLLDRTGAESVELQLGEREPVV